MHAFFEGRGTLGGRSLASICGIGEGERGAYDSGGFFGGFFGGVELEGRGFGGFGVAAVAELVEERGGLLG